MPYVVFDGVPDTLGVGRTVRDACTDPGTGAYACAVDEIMAGEREIDADAFNAIKQSAEADYIGNPSPPFVAPLLPDAAQFKVAAYAYLGGAAFVMPLAGYIAPVIDSLNASNWALARQIIGAAAQAGALTGEQYTHLGSLMAEHNIP